MKTLSIFHDAVLVSYRVDGVSHLPDTKRAGPVLAKKLDSETYIPVSVIPKSLPLEIDVDYRVVKNDIEWVGSLIEKEPLTILTDDRQVVSITDPELVILADFDTYRESDFVVVDQPARIQYPIWGCNWSASHLLQIGSLSSKLETFATISMTEPMTAHVTLHDRDYFQSQTSRSLNLAAESTTAQLALSTGMRDYLMGKVKLHERTLLPLTSQEVIPSFSIVHHVNSKQTTQVMTFSADTPVPSGSVAIFLDDIPLANRYLQEGETVRVEGLPVKDVKCKTSIARTSLPNGRVKETITVKATGRSKESVSIRVIYDIPHNLEVLESSCGAASNTKRMEWDLVINEASTSEVTFECHVSYRRLTGV